jgi:DNA-directed RNA polymerase specialized sigma24 family protein
MEKGYWDNVSDNYLAERIRVSNCENSLNELIKRHSALCFKIIQRYSGTFYANNIDITEASSDKNLIIWNSAKSFSIDKNVKFSTWLANQVKYSCLNALNKKSKDRLITTEDKTLDALKEQAEERGDDNLFEFTSNILNQLKDKRINFFDEILHPLQKTFVVCGRKTLKHEHSNSHKPSQPRNRSSKKKNQKRKILRLYLKKSVDMLPRVV